MQNITGMRPTQYKNEEAFWDCYHPFICWGNTQWQLTSAITQQSVSSLSEHFCILCEHRRAFPMSNARVANVPDAPLMYRFHTHTHRLNRFPTQIVTKLIYSKTHAHTDLLHVQYCSSLDCDGLKSIWNHQKEAATCWTGETSAWTETGICWRRYAKQGLYKPWFTMSGLFQENCYSLTKNTSLADQKWNSWQSCILSR